MKLHHFTFLLVTNERIYDMLRFLAHNQSRVDVMPR